MVINHSNIFLINIYIEGDRLAYEAVKLLPHVWAIDKAIAYIVNRQITNNSGKNTYIQTALD